MHDILFMCLVPRLYPREKKKNVMIRCVLLFMLVSLELTVRAQEPGKPVTLQECYDLAARQNALIMQAKHGLKAKEYTLDAEKRSHLPKVDLLAGYNYLGKPLEINLQQVKNSVVEGSSQQSVNTANEVFNQITGQQLPQAVQDRIFNATQSILNTVYPNYNPTVAKQQYFTASLGFREAIYLGGKLSAVQDLAQARVTNGQWNQQVVEKGLYLLIGLQYLRIMYLNNILQHEERIVAAFKKNQQYAAALKANEILPPYLLNWAKVSLVQAESRYRNQQLEKQNALLELNKLMGLPLETAINVTDTLRYIPNTMDTQAAPDFYEQNPTYRLLESNSALAQVAVKTTRSLSLPNIFAIGNINLYQKDLPLTVPPWLLGVEMQWNLFDGFQKQKRMKASKQLVEETRMITENTRATLEVSLQVCINKMKALRNDVAALDTARQQARLTTTLIEERLRSEMSSVKDVNDALLMEEEMEKIYYTGVLGYYLALAEYWSIVGTPQRLQEFIK
jgi:outer membrane protein TolC